MTTVTREGFNITSYYNAFGRGIIRFCTSTSIPSSMIPWAHKYK